MYAWLKAGRIDRPIVPLLFYAMLTGPGFWETTARPYALAILLVTASALFAYLAVEAPRQSGRAATYSVLMAIACGAAFQTQYVTISSTGVILLWFVLHQWSRSRVLALGSPFVALFLMLANYSTLVKQINARSDQGIGFGSLARQLRAMIALNKQQLWRSPLFPISAVEYLVPIGLVLLLGITIWFVVSRWRDINRNFWTLVLGVALAPTIGLFLISVVLKKNLFSPQFVSWSVPAFAILLAYPMARLWLSKQLLGSMLIACVFLLQMLCINWGYEAGPVQTGGDMMLSVAKAIKESSDVSQLVLIDQGCSNIKAGCGFQFPGALIYELDPQTNIVTFGDGAKVEKLLSMANLYDDVWVAFGVMGTHGVDPGTVLDLPDDNVRKKLFRGLKSAGRHMELFPSSPFPFYYHAKREL